MLTANVGFLAVPGMVPYNFASGIWTVTHKEILFTSLSLVACILSVEASIGSIVIGLLLVRHNRMKQEADPSEAVSEQLHLTWVSR
jgi:hypothetical protein